MPYQSLKDIFNNPEGGYGDHPKGKFLKYDETPGSYRRTENDPYLYYHNYNRVPFDTGDDIKLVSPELPPQDVLPHPRQYHVENNIRDILGGNNRSGFDNQTIDQVYKLAGTTAPLTPKQELVRHLLHGLLQQHSQGFIKTPPIQEEQYSQIGMPNVDRNYRGQ